MATVARALKSSASNKIRGVARQVSEYKHGRAFDTSLSKNFLTGGPGPEELRAELAESGLLEHLVRSREWFREHVRGHTTSGSTYKTGELDVRAGFRLYCLLRHLRPRIAVETGVCNGFSTAFILSALQRNGDGTLYSIDLPEVAGETTEASRFWQGKGGAVVPAGKEPGWVVPADLRTHWRLIQGRSQDVLPSLLDELGTIGFFLHDSEHSPECMRFEFERAFPHLEPEGVLAADNARANTTFEDFAQERGRRAIWLSHAFAALRT
jgi:predicted O-methyltransferase YrrM